MGQPKLPQRPPKIAVTNIAHQIIREIATNINKMPATNPAKKLTAAGVVQFVAAGGEPRAELKMLIQALSVTELCRVRHCLLSATLVPATISVGLSS